MIGIIKNINIPFIVISWWAINTYDVNISVKIIMKSLLNKYFLSFLISCMAININTNKGI